PSGVRVRAFDAAVPSINEVPRIPSPNPLPGGEGFIAGPHTSHYVGRSRSARRMILPVVVIGSAPMNTTRRGYSCAARRVLTKSWISRASASDGAWLGFKTRKALISSVRTGSGAALRTDGAGSSGDL